MKKFISLVLALVMALSLTTVAWGAATTVTTEQQLKDALAAGGDVVLGANITIANTTGTSDWAVVGSGKTVTLDLAGYTITRTANDTLGAIRVLGELIVNDSSTNKTGGISGGDYAIVVGWKGLEGTGAKLTINGGTFTGGYAITGNGTVPTGNNTTNWGTTITINGGTITGTDVGIYHPQVGTLTINGGTISGATGVEVRGGTLEITGGEISATSNTYSSVANGNGATSTGVAVAVAQHTTKQAIDVTISGGELNGVKAFAEENPEQNTAPAVTIDITDGEFNGDVVVTDDQSTEISGGTINGNVDEDLLADDVILSATGSVVPVPSGAAIPAGGPTLVIDTDDLSDPVFASWTAKVSSEDAENAKKYEFATYSIEMTAKVDGAPIWWDAGVEDKGEKVDFDIYGEEEFVKVASEAAWFAVIDGKNITYFAPASEYNTNGWDEKATKVELPYVVPSKQVCDTDYAASPAATTFYKFNGDLYVADSASTFVLNVGGVAVPASAATNGTEYVNRGHDYVCDWDDNDYGETVLTKVYCDDCGKEFKFVNAPEADAILTFGVDKYVDTEVTFGGQPIFVGLGAVADAPAADAEGDKVESAETFDAGIAMYVGMSVMAAAGSAVVLKKKD